MNPQPTIFISSIISEFYDLRGSLKYFLGKSGFRVLMSEEPDFGADCSLDSLDNCKKQIEKADYYLLLIGNKPGTIFNIEDRTPTVTFEEFNHYIKLVRSGKPLNFIAFVRQQAWDNYVNQDTTRIDPLQISLIKELLENTLFEDKKIGRWRYTFDRFSDIISVLETNQNGLFLESTRKTGIYRSYIKREVTDIFTTLLEKNRDTGKIQSVNEIIELPQLDHLDYLQQSKIDRRIAANIVTFLIIISNKNTVLRKLNRVFNYLAQGEFSRFDPVEEKYVHPEYIKLTIQTLEILERIFDSNKNSDLYEKIKGRNTENFYINRIEYNLVRSLYNDLKLVTQKLIRLTVFFHNNWFDLPKQSDESYAYRGGGELNITDQELLHYAENFNNLK